ncbi:MAG: glycoside hydrolase family protein [Kiritimatiellae bacterium]|nr:glycoside hydrolase family protein [Kiritimatiellia bacterium]MDD5523265.1 glycoside hydrolase family protein [Kiritimatiellia bacterium]
MITGRILLVFVLLTGVVKAADGEAVGDDLDIGTMIQPVPVKAKFCDPEYDIWCGSMVRSDDGKCHLYYSRWPRKLGHQAWVTHSEVAHAVADNPFGPYKHVDVALPARGKDFWDGLCTHNPTVIKANGKYCIYYMGNTGDGQATKGLNWVHRNNQRIGVAVAITPDGPWQRFDKPVIDVSADADAPDALMTSNPSVTPQPGGGFLMVYKAVAKKGKPPFYGPVTHLTATSDSPTGPFKKNYHTIFGKEGVTFAAEDPFVWYGKDRYWAVVKDNAGHFTNRGKSLALFESKDGLDWQLAKHPFVSTTEITWADGSKQKMDALERPQVWLENGIPAVLFCAVGEKRGRDGSFNIQIPLKAGK